MCVQGQNETYEDRFGPVNRRVRRMLRALRWTAKGAAGAQGRILVEIRWRLGDEIMAIPVYEAIKRQYPDSQLAVLCSYPELLDANPYVDAVNPEDPSPDRYILLRGAPRTAYRLGHYARRAGVPPPEARPRLYYEDWSAPVLRRLDTQDRPLVTVSSGATWLTKRWNVACWARVCRGLQDLGYTVVQLGRGDEHIGVGACLVDETDVREAACVLHEARLFIGGDSGLMHLALAAGTKTLALFGPTDPSILVRDEPNLSVLTNNRDCHGCWNDPKREAQEGVCPLGIPECLAPITPEQVLARARELLD